MALSLKQREEREKIVAKMIEDGASVVDIAQRLGVRPETVSKFLKIREWETAGMIEHREKMEAKYGSTEDEQSDP